MVRLRSHFSVCRLEDRTAPSAGILDPTFGVGGRVTTPFLHPSNENGKSTAIDSLGRIVVAGHLSNGSDVDFVVVRYTPAGALDTTFGGIGIVTFGIGSYADFAESVAIDSLDRIVVAGQTLSASDSDFAVARLTAAGALDGSFDFDGKQTVDFGASYDYAYGVAVDSLDRIVVAGKTETVSGSNRDFAVARLTAGGALDSSFSGDGRQTIDFGTSFEGAYDLAVDSLDRVVVTGYADNGSNEKLVVARLTVAGALDSSFDGDGKQTVTFGSFSNQHPFAVAVDSLNRVLVAGYTYTFSLPDFAVARLTAGGALDNSFDGDGKQTIAFDPGDDEAFGVTVDSLDRVVVAGFTDNGSNYDVAVARLTAAGALDGSFDGDGRQTVAFGASFDRAHGVAIDSKDRVVLAGHSSFCDSDAFALARLTGDTTTAVVQVNDGSAQRSMVTSFTVTFSQPVSFPSGLTAAIQLQRSGPGAPTDAVTLAFSQAGNGVTVTFNDPTFAPGTAESLIDGNYILTLVAANIQSASGNLDGNGDGTPGGDLNFNLHRLFGDSDGNGTVNGTDFAAFRTAFGMGASLFDFDNDGQTNATDFAEFRKRFGITLDP